MNLLPTCPIVRLLRGECKGRGPFSLRHRPELPRKTGPAGEEEAMERSMASGQPLRVPLAVVRKMRDWGTSSGAAQHLGGRWDCQIGLVHPAAGIRRAMPALQRNRADVVALLVVENFEECL